MSFFACARCMGWSNRTSARVDRSLSGRHPGSASGRVCGRGFALERGPTRRTSTRVLISRSCARRCHSVARSALQRRDESEWRKLAQPARPGMWPSLEIPRPDATAVVQIAIVLAGKALRAVSVSPLLGGGDYWRKRPARDLSAAWIVVGRVPGGRDFYGTSTRASSANGENGAVKLHWRGTSCMT